jgi:NAD(P)H dehydrogenase (quinone)
MYGHIEVLAKAVAEGARLVKGVEVTVKRVPALMSDEEARRVGAKFDQEAPINSRTEPNLYID